jgi:hypothetical protein
MLDVELGRQILLQNFRVLYDHPASGHLPTSLLVCTGVYVAFISYPGFPSHYCTRRIIPFMPPE